MKLYLVFLITLGIILILDFLWLGVISSKFYKKEFGDLMRPNFNYIAAIFVYICLALGITIFVFNNNFSTNLYLTVFLGALFGLIVYGVYDLTNFAVIKDYSLKLLVVDMVWGTFLCGFVSLLVKLITKF